MNTTGIATVPPASGKSAPAQVAAIPAETSTLPPHLRRPRLRRPQTAEYLLARHGIVLAVSTLAKWGSLGTGPKYGTIGRTPYYAVTDIDAWVASQLEAAS
ncbi:hypothetical protein [Reyranella sp.]|jgi:hypothetical protein|uniref:helix-turn-helix transcriptional regulator n=1 Tax=Reyranella sp. TaxID=1929291 RepID=UPI000BDABDE5|nr:hypothetical protein [Reyranella sp.]OYY40463.1 MAG: hypothetical protein B7Y57_17285 [Rhodospirillales bacterium 35-66-84]OYZ93080.1 MAG: hypothetical protein B7Y08_18535 [Rhodospirillales bacterium 24-66-33]OZB24208.1 MAG: hypothetical protein B7X63_16495 [Rhodospirillales bacterium 39-66-50]HQS18804.1 hypothetical protein [Reyranella sp.]HQT14887.1 hypothetical protein [Reyranella sp.]